MLGIVRLSETCPETGTQFVGYHVGVFTVSSRPLTAEERTQLFLRESRMGNAMIVQLVELDEAGS